MLSLPRASISYPTDLALLNGAGVHTEKLVDILYKKIKGQINKKPRTYRTAKNLIQLG
jgi:hypothetical protein